jgi:hypothetical protein
MALGKFNQLINQFSTDALAPKLRGDEHLENPGMWESSTKQEVTDVDVSALFLRSCNEKISSLCSVVVNDSREKA